MHKSAVHKTRKNKGKKSNKNKKFSKKRKNTLWNMFDKDLNIDNNELECCYTKSNVLIRENCDLCSSPVAYDDKNFLVCTNDKCSVLYTDILDNKAEWRFYGAADNNISNPTRCGMPINPLLVESSFGCKVYCNGRSTYEMKKIKRYTEWQSMPYKEKSQYDEYEKIKTMSHNAGIPKIIVDDALRYHKKISESKTFRGCNRSGIIAASIYISCRINSYPRTAKEISAIFNIDISSSTKGCKNALHILNNLEREHEHIKSNLCETRSIDFIERYCSKLNINEELTKLSQFLAFKIEKNNLMPENTPHSVAAGIVYFVSQSCNLNISKKDVNNCSEISEVTINKCFKKLNKIKSNIMPKVILMKYGL